MGAKKSLVDWLGEVADPRTGPAKRHDLVEILVVAICGILSGAESWTEIELWGQLKLAWLRRYLRLENGIASHDTFGRVFRLLDSRQFEAAFRGWVKGVIGAVRGGIAVDGKTVRGSHDGERRAIHMVSVWATRLGLALGQEKVAEKSNEIDAVPELLQALALKGCLVSIDAMGCQREIARCIRQMGADYLLAVKGNQESLEQSLVEYFDAGRLERLSASSGHLETVEKDHGRIERRRYWLAENVFGLVDASRWQDCRQVGVVESVRDTGHGKPSVERRYFITSASCNVAEFAAAVRDHWQIENKLHWSLDVIFREDACRVRKDHAAHNFAILRRFGLNLLRLDTSSPKLSLLRRRRRAAWDDDYLARILNLQPVG